MIFPKVDKTENLLRKSGLILDVFQSTAEQLASVNNEIDEEKGILEVQRLEIESKEKALEAQKQQNEKVVGKIKQFLEE